MDELDNFGTISLFTISDDEYDSWETSRFHGVSSLKSRHEILSSHVRF